MNEVNILYGAVISLIVAITIIGLQNHRTEKRLYMLKNLVESMGMYLATKHMEGQKHEHTEQCQH